MKQIFLTSRTPYATLHVVNSESSDDFENIDISGDRGECFEDRLLLDIDVHRLRPEEKEIALKQCLNACGRIVFNLDTQPRHKLGKLT